MSGNGDYGAVREDVLAETRERAGSLASQGLLAREIEHRLDYRLTATERELLSGIIRQEVARAHAVRPAEGHGAIGNLRRPDSSGGGPALRAARGRWENAKRRASSRFDGDRTSSVLAVVPVALGAVAFGVVVGLLLAGGHQRGSTAAHAGASGMRRPASASSWQKGAAGNSTKRTGSSPRKSPPASPAETLGSQGGQSTLEPRTGVLSAAQLNDRGFRLMNSGRYAEAIPLLRRAISASSPRSTDLTYAYALFNLGRSLRLARRPQEAIPLLERRLRIKNQRATVARELEAARRSARSTGGAQ